MKRKSLLFLLLMAVFAPWAAQAQEQQTITCYPPTQQYATGYTDGTDKTSGDMHCESDGGVRGWMKFDVSSIPTGATINSIKVYFYCTSTSNSYVKLTAAGELDPATASASNLFSAIGTESPNYYTSSYMSGFSSTGWKNFSLSNAAISNLQTNGLTNNYFTLGFYEYETYSGYKLYASGYEDDNKPYIVVTCTVPVSCPKPNDLTCTASTGNPAPSATFSWTNGGTETDWVLEYGLTSDFTGATSISISESDLVNGKYTISTGLTAETKHYARIKADCGGGEESNWSDVCEFKPTAAIPQTVCDGTVPGTTATTNSFVPVYGNYAENYNKDEFIIPATTEGMDIVTDGTIQGLTFYLYSPASDLWGNALYRVFIKEVNESAFANTSYYGTEGATIVYEGALDGTHSTMTIDFTTDYVYNGGNLLVGIYEYNKGTFKSCSFSGIESTNGSMYKNNSTSLENITTGNLQNFIPKTTFTYLPSATPRPRKLQVSDISSNGATVSWQAPANATPTSYQYRLNNGSNWTGWESTADLSVDLNLSASTPYTVQVKAIYGAGESVLVETSFTTLDACAYPTNLMPYTVAGEGTTATLSWRPGYDETAWVLQYATKADFSEGLVEITNGFVTQVVEEVTYILRPLTGLTPEQTYYARVKANCDGPTSEWSNVVNFTPTNFVDFHFRETATGSSYQIPFYYNTTYTTNQSQFVIPAAELADLNGGTIRSITYYTSNTTITDWGGVAFDVYMAEVENAVFSSATFIDWTTLTQVYSGTVSLDNGKMTITFDQNYTYNGGNLLIGFQNKTIGTSTTSMSWRAYTSGSTYYGVYQYGSSSSPTITRSYAQPKITINYQPSPYRKPVINEPQCTFGTTTAHIAWTVSGGATPTGYQFQYKPSSIPTWPTGWNTVETNYKDLVELTPGIFYDFRVKALYEGNHESNTVDYKFVTECVDIVTIDATHSWSEGFEGYNNGSSAATITNIHCWDRVQVNTTTNSPFVYANYGYAASTGTASLELKTSSSTPVMVALPEFSAAIDDLNVTFNYNCTSTSNTYTAELGYITDVADATTFVKLLDIPTPVARGSHSEFSEDLHGVLAAAAPEHSRIAICFATTSTSTPSWNFDDFVVSYVSLYKPTNLTVDGLTASTATLSWTETGTATSWQICLNDDEEHLIVADANPFTIPGLTEDASYTAKVRAVDGVNHSAWSTSVSFAPTDKITIGSGTGTNSNLPAQCNYDYSYSQQIYTVAELGNAGVIESIDFYMTGTADYTYSIDVYMVSTDKSSFTGNTDWIAVTDNNLVFSNDVTFNGNAWTTITLDNSFVYDGTKNVAIIVDGQKASSWATKSFRSFSVESNQSHYGYQDNTDINPSNPGTPTYNYVSTAKNQIRILKSPMSACMKPMGLTATQVGPDFAVLNWTENGESTSWVVAYKAEGESTFTERVVTSNVDLNFDGLTPETPYTLKVRPSCDESLWSSEISFTTLASCPAPQNVEVSNILHTTADVSWTGFSTSYNVIYRVAPTLSDPPIFSEDFSNGIGDWTMSNCNSSTGVSGEVFRFRWSTTPPQYLISPEISGIDEESILEFKYWDYGYVESFQVGYSTTTAEVASFTFGSEINTEGDSETNTYHGTVPAGTKYISIKCTSNDQYYLYIDDIVIAEPVTSPWITIENATNPQPLTALTADNKYEVKVQGVCSGIPGQESAVKTFTTLSANHKLFLTEGDWNVDANWAPNGAPTIEQDVELRANVTITGEAFANSITQSTYSVTIEDGGKLKHLSGNVYANVQKAINAWTVEGSDTEDPNGYYLIANPITSNYTPKTDGSDGILVGNYDLYSWDYSQADEWRNFKNNQFTFLNSCQYNSYGYLYANEQGTTLSFTGSIKTASASLYRTCYSTTSTSYDFPGWYLLGNSFVCDAYLAAGSATGNALPFIRMNADGNGFENVAAGGVIAPLEGVFFQASSDFSGSVYVTTTQPPVQSKGQLNMNLRKDNKQLDNAILVFGGEQQLGKFSFRESSSKIYMPVEGKDLAITSVEGQVGEQPISFKAEHNGNYTLSFTAQEVSFSYLHLIDNLTGNDVNLLETPSYSFDAQTTDYASRFRLVFATGSSVDGDSFGFVNGMGNLCIFGIEGEATIQVIDILGHMISSDTFSGSYERKLNVAPGVYMIRLINGNDVKVQKIVVR